MKPATAFCRCGGARLRVSQHVPCLLFLDHFQKKGVNPALALKYTRIHLLNYYQLAETQMDHLARQALKVHPGVSSARL